MEESENLALLAVFVLPSAAIVSRGNSVFFAEPTAQIDEPAMLFRITRTFPTVKSEVIVQPLSSERTA